VITATVARSDKINLMNMNNTDIRWEQRFLNFEKALKKLEEAVNYIRQNHHSIITDDISDTGALSELIKQGLIQSFEFTHELAWNAIKDYAAYQGNPEIKGSRDAAREAFAMGLIPDGEIWMDMIISINKTSHTYNEITADNIFKKIINDYLSAFTSLKDKMITLKNY
jgi:nucleotidyltransferase substrate binding protein (TIGR01987 family)